VRPAGVRLDAKQTVSCVLYQEREGAAREVGAGV
jgi:hypothetical protein